MGPKTCDFSAFFKWEVKWRQGSNFELNTIYYDTMTDKLPNWPKKLKIFGNGEFKFNHLTIILVN